MFKKPDPDTTLGIIFLLIFFLIGLIYSHGSKIKVTGNSANCRTNGSMLVTNGKEQRSPWCNNGEKGSTAEASPYIYRLNKHIYVPKNKIRYL